MKTLLRIILALVGFGVTGVFVYNINPYVLDTMGLVLFYAALMLGVFNLLVLLGLTRAQGVLLSGLLLAFLLLQQLRIFNIWLGAILVVLTVFTEQFIGERKV